MADQWTVSQSYKVQDVQVYCPSFRRDVSAKGFQLSDVLAKGFQLAEKSRRKDGHAVNLHVLNFARLTYGTLICHLFCRSVTCLIYTLPLTKTIP